VSAPSPYELFEQTGGGDAYRVAMLEHGHVAPISPQQQKKPGKRIQICGLLHQSDWSEWRRYGNATEGFYEGRWCRTCSHTQARALAPSTTRGDS
jgi:hypothetical protein